MAYLYDKSGKTLLERGCDASCLSHQLNALGNYAGGEFQRTSKCFKRGENSPVIHPTEAEFLSPGLYDSPVVMETFPRYTICIQGRDTRNQLAAGIIFKLLSEVNRCFPPFKFAGEKLGPQLLTCGAGINESSTWWTGLPVNWHKIY